MPGRVPIARAEESLSSGLPVGGARASWLAALAATCALLVWAPIATFSLDRWQLPKELAVEGCALVAVLATGRTTRLRVLDLALLTAAALTLASVALAVVPWVAARTGGLTIAAVALALRLRDDDPEARDGARLAALAAVGIVATLALAQTAGLFGALSDPGRAPGATLGQRNIVAHVLAIAAPFAWRAAVSGRSALARALGLLVLVVSCAAIVATRSRAGWLALGIGVLAMLASAMRGDSRRTHGLVALAVLAAIVVAVSSRPALLWTSAHPYRETAAHLLDTESGSGLGRVIQARASLALVTMAPMFGVGPGNWRVVYPSVSPPGDPTFDAEAIDPVNRLMTCDVVATLVERGILGTLMGLALLGLWIAQVRADPDRDLRAASYACAAASVPLLCFDTVLQTAPTLAMFVVLLTPRASGDALRVPKQSGAIGTVLLATLSTLVVAHRSIELTARAIGAERVAGREELARAAAIDPGDFDARMQLARAWRGLGDCTHAISLLEEAVALRPFDPAPRADLAGCAPASSR